MLLCRLLNTFLTLFKNSAQPCWLDRVENWHISKYAVRQYDTRSSSVDEIGERYGEIPITAWFNFTVTFAYSSADRDFFGAPWLFWLLRLINTITYLLTYLLMSLFLINTLYLYQFCRKTRANHVVWNNFFIGRPRMLWRYSYESLQHYKSNRWTVCVSKA